MNRIKPFLSVILLLVVTSPALKAQDGNKYKVPAEPLYWVSDNPYRLYLVRGGDTIPGRIRGITVSRHSWTPAGDRFQVITESVDAGLGTRARTDTMIVSARGEVLLINGQTDYAEGEWDALLRLPATPVEVGLQWSDTISQPIDGPHGTGVYAVRRSYRVTRELESLDGRRFEIDVEGQVDFKLSMWTDSVAGTYRWFDLHGPMEETFVFDPVAGQLHRRTWSMSLEGIGGSYDGVTLDTVVAGLRSKIRVTESPRPGLRP